MAETYCGKSCEDCSQREVMNCPGCRVGPGREISGECELARCVREKGHETCDTCLNRMRCGTFQSRERMPDYRRRKQEAQAYEERARAERAPVLGKWLWLLFWLVVPSTLAALMSLEFFQESAPTLFLIGKGLNFACSLAYGLVLLKLGQEDDGYRTAGICALIAGAISLLVSLVTGGETRAWTLVLTLPAAVVAFYGEYMEYMTHSAMLRGTDNTLSDQWETLWKWHIGTYIAMFGGIFLMLLIPILGLLAALGGAIGLVVVSILKLVYLYRTAAIFREYTPVTTS